MNQEDDTIEQGAINIQSLMKSWDSLTTEVSKKKMSLATYLQEAQPVTFSNNCLIIGLSKDSSFQKESLESPENLKLIREIFSDFLGEKIAVKYKFIEEFEPREEDGHVQDALNMFGGKVINRWHNE